MRTLKISLLVFISSITISAQWFWQNPIPQANDILDSYFIDEMNGWAVGVCGACIKTTDGGENWEHSQMPIHDIFESVHFVNEDKGFIGDWGGNLLKTTDGGNTWDVQHIEDYTHIRVFFVDQSYGWLLSYSKIYRTTDGGGTYQSYPLNNMTNVFFIDSSKGFVIGGSGNIMMSTDGGINWSYVNSPIVQGLEKITFKNAEEGFIVGDDGTLLRTTNGGTIWEYQVLGQNRLWDISFYNENKGIIVGNDSKIFMTSDGGVTWLDKTFSSIWALEACTYLTENDCVVLGELGDIYKSTDNGNNWICKVLGDRNTINDITFIDYQTGYTVGSEGTILKTTNRGNNWYKLNPLTNEELKSISFADNFYGWIVGTNSVFLKSTSGGIGWTIDTIPDCNNLLSVDFINNNVGWVAGNYSKILKTTDGGNTWIPQPINFSYTIDFSSIFMVDENNGYVCGIYRSFFPTRGIIFKTTNGGANWDSLIVINTEFKSIFFKDLFDGWAAGYASTTIHTTDGGVTWINVPIGGGNDIFFSDRYNGIKVSNVTLWSDISITTNGGETWVQQPIVTNQYLNAAYIIENNYWVAGMGGAILYSNNPNVTNLGFENSNNESPIEGTLSQNYPNPFNPVTKIKYTIPSFTLRKDQSDILVTLKIYDILGREVVTLVNGEKPAGEYEVEFDGSNLPTGIYFYQIKAGQYSETKKMVLLK